jgi:protein-L-isoaspartate(D-aspartate) O-methyltransferase
MRRRSSAGWYQPGGCAMIKPPAAPGPANPGVGLKRMTMTAEDKYTAVRRRMVDTQIAVRGVSDLRVLEAMRKVPRHCFIPAHLWDQAYGDYPLPIGEDQTISQPYIVALMTELLELKSTDKVLEVGTGSGYQAAILAELAAQVCTIDRMASLLAQAERVLKSLGYTNIRTRVGDGTLGWPEEMPFEAIIVTAGAPQVPRPLTEQLALGGRLVIPVGDRWSQTLTCVRKTKEGLKLEYHGGCRFVRLIGAYGWEEGGWM